jgi:hypothetical protein
MQVRICLNVAGECGSGILPVLDTGNRGFESPFPDLCMTKTTTVKYVV